MITASLAVVSAAPSEFCDVCKYAVQQVDQLALQNEAGTLNIGGIFEIFIVY